MPAVEIWPGTGRRDRRIRTDGRKTAGGTSTSDGPPGQGPAAIIASALSHLQRKSGKTYKAIALDAQVDPSYISRILSGERMPSDLVG